MPDICKTISRMTEILTSGSAAMLLRDEMSYFSDTEILPSGSVICRYKGTQKTGRRILIATNFGAPFMTVSALREDGRADIAVPDGVKGEMFASSPMRLHGKKVGRLEILDGEFVLETGAAGCDGDVASGRITVGDRLYPCPEFEKLSDSLVCAFPLAAALRCVCALRCAELLSAKNMPDDVSIVLTPDCDAQYRLFGAAVRETGCDAAISIGTVSESESKLVHSGEGAALRIRDGRYSADMGVAEKITKASEYAGVKVFPVVLNGGGCGGAELISAGVPAAELDIPLKYGGARCECAAPSDIEAVSSLSASLCCIGLHGN